MNLPPDQVAWLTHELVPIMEKCKEKNIHPAVFMFVLQSFAENAYMDKLHYMSQEEWDAIKQQAKEEIHVARKVSKKELNFEEALDEVRKLRMR